MGVSAFSWIAWRVVESVGVSGPVAPQPVTVNWVPGAGSWLASRANWTPPCCNAAVCRVMTATSATRVFVSNLGVDGDLRDFAGGGEIVPVGAAPSHLQLAGRCAVDAVGREDDLVTGNQGATADLGQASGPALFPDADLIGRGLQGGVRSADDGGGRGGGGQRQAHRGG